MAKVDNLLSTLRGETPPEETSPEAAAPSGEALAPLQRQIQELERKIEEMSAPPPLEEAPIGGEEEVVAPPERPQPQPPQPPTELALFLQTRMDLLERKLQLAQEEALRANLLLREREAAQRKARGEVEDLFRNIREQQRAASWDRALRDQYSAAQGRIRELESRLSLAELRMIPAEDVLRCMEDEEGRGELERRLREQLGRLEAETEAPSAPEPSMPGVPTSERAPEPGPPAPPAPEQIPPPPGVPPPETSRIPELSIIMGRVADLERLLDEARKERDRERKARRLWEKDILLALNQTRREWQKKGGPELLVEAALESMVDSLKGRDALQVEMSRAVAALRDEPPGSARIPELRARLAECQKRMAELQEKLGKQVALLQAWVERNKGKGS
ncbi:MAG: hypothetical protein ABII00_04265 [Elusimicrobiota bacterium]